MLLRWRSHLELFRQLSVRFAAPLVVLAAGLPLAHRFQLSGDWNMATVVGFLTVWLLSVYLCDSGLRRILGRWLRRPRYPVAATCIVFFWVWLRHTPEAFDYRQLAFAAATGAVGGLAQRFFLRQARRTRSTLGEALRWLGLIGVCSWVIHPYATTQLVGGGDAHHYAQQLTDAAEQFRNGDYEMYVGNSAHAFNGDIHPLRTAPYFSYLGAVVSLFAGPTLTAVAVQNLLIVLSLAASVAGIYLLLTRLRPSAACAAFWLACAYGTSPGVLALIYSGDMIATWLTLPWLPIVFYSVIRLWDTPHPAPTFGLLAAALAMVWLAHPPVALWTSFLVGLVLAARLVMHREKGRAVTQTFAGLALCFMLCGYVFVSVYTLQMPSDPNLVANVRSGANLATLKAGWAGLGQPIDAAGADLIRNLQLGPALWLAFLVALVATIARPARHWAVGLLTLGAVSLLLLLVPSPFISGGIWAIMPEIVIDATHEWPMQRFYPILSALVPFLALHAWPRAGRGLFQRAPQFLVAGLAAGVVYSAFDVRKLVARGYSITSSPLMSDLRMRPENALMSRYSYEYFGQLPSGFSHGTMNPIMQNRLLARGSLEPIDLNRLALNRAVPDREPRLRTQHVFVPTDYGGYFNPSVRLDSKQVYFARFQFTEPEVNGTLQLLGKFIYREYVLPLSGAPMAFGTRPDSRDGFTLWTTGPEADEVQVRFYAQPGRPPISNLGTLELLSLNPNRLPLQTLSGNPFRVAVRSAADSWLETPKIFIDGYQARVDGRSAPVMRSPDGLAMVPVPAGLSRVDLSYVGPPALRVAFGITLLSWIAVLGLYVWSWRSPTILEKSFHFLGRGAVVGCVLGAVVLGIIKGYPKLDPTQPFADLKETAVGMNVSLPIGLTSNWEPVWHFNHQGDSWSIFVFYEGSQKIRVGLARDGSLHSESNLATINYLRDHEVVAKLTTEPGENHSRLKIWFNNRLMLDSLLKPDPKERVVPVGPFRGKIHRVGPKDEFID
jgi:hypothetical protein